MSIKSIAKTGAIALVAVAVANRIPQVKELLEGDGGWF